MKYEFSIEYEITDCYKCPMKSVDGLGEDICGFDCRRISFNNYGALSLGCPLSVVKEK